ncbi:MAG: TSUP family transporter, partial [Phycisphaerae bacterium]|nr:TSUP family transporter [Phycisphaerae bacterium]
MKLGLYLHGRGLEEMPEIAQILLLAAVGFGGGCLGGFLGIGGSIIFIPTLKYLGVDPHPAIAAALVVNVLVASGGARGHLRSGRVRKRVLAVLIPVAISAAVIGVLVGNQFTNEHAIWIWRIFGIVMIYVLVHNAMRLRGELGVPAEANPG